MKYLYAFLIFAGFSILFIVIYVLNSRTKRPEGCEESPEECVGCKVSICKNNPNKDNKENR